jgi:Rieske Fe-S protein
VPPVDLRPRRFRQRHLRTRSTAHAAVADRREWGRIPRSTFGLPRTSRT